MILLRQMIILMVLMLTGFLCRKLKVLGKEAFKPLSVLVTLLANPALILYSSLENVLTISTFELLKVVAFSFLVYACLLFASKIAAFFMVKQKSMRNLYVLMLAFSNIGFMGIPLVKMAYGAKELFYMTVFQMPYDLLIYTYGVYLISKNDERHSKGKCQLKSFAIKLINPGSIAAVGAVIIYIFHIDFPLVLSEPLKMLGNIASPISMMVIGASFYDIRLKDFLIDYELLFFSVIKLIVLPALLVIIFCQCNINVEMLHVCLIVFSTPVGSMVVMLSQQSEYNQELANKSVAFNTLLSVITIPVIQSILEIIR